LAAYSCPCVVEAANRVTSNCWYQRRCGAVGVHLGWRRHLSKSKSFASDEGCAGCARLLTRDGLRCRMSPKDMYCVMHIYTSLAAVASLWVAPHAPPAAGGVLAPRSHPWLGAPGPRHAVAVHRPTHRRAARAGDIACSTHCRELERLPWSSPRAGTACLHHVPGSEACRSWLLSRSLAPA
jgi:hypothetical protein